MAPFRAPSISAAGATWQVRLEGRDDEGSWMRVLDLERVGDGVSVELRVMFRQHDHEAWEIDQRQEWQLELVEAAELAAGLAHLVHGGDGG